MFHSSPSSSKRMASSMDVDKVEIPPPVNDAPKSKKQKEVMHEGINVDNDDNSAKVALKGDIVVKSEKGKAIELIQEGYGDSQTMLVFDDLFLPCGKAKSGSESKTKAGANNSPVSTKSSQPPLLPFKIPKTEIEEPSKPSTQGPSAGPPEIKMLPKPYFPLNWSNLGPRKVPHVGQALHMAHLQNLKESSGSTSSLRNHSLFAGPSSGSTISLQNRSRFAGPTFGFPVPGGASANVLGMKNSFPFQPFPTPSHSCNPIRYGFGPHYAPPQNLFPTHGYSPDPISYAFGPYSSPQNLFPAHGFTPEPIPFAFGTYSSHRNMFPTHSSYGFGPNYPAPQNLFHAPRVQLFPNVWVPNTLYNSTNGTASSANAAPISDEARYEILKKFQNFKQFDIVQNGSDHFYVHNVNVNQPSNQWAKRIMEEWKMLEKNLPDTIFVRVFESRLDLLRAVIIGAEGTPYHDGIFFFDIKFPNAYPNVPPLVHYRSCGLKLNPNLYHCGKVCLSLLGTWSGAAVTERWIPNVSTILQVLVSIQGLILTPEPYYNEPGVQVVQSGTKAGEICSLRYNEDTFLLSLKSMVYIMRNPPKNFEDFVAGHFCTRAQEIILACKAYIAGAKVGCFVKGGVQNLDQGNKSCSIMFKRSLAAYVNLLVNEFTKAGAKDCAKITLSQAAENPLRDIQMNEAAPTAAPPATVSSANEATAATIVADASVAATVLADNAAAAPAEWSAAFSAKWDATILAAAGGAAISGEDDDSSSSSSDGAASSSDDYDRVSEYAAY
ncbi:probable ubiquitin-conjugating enzyme E2 25 isoform X2 [Cajanus cajan]|uniref:probable ubiquitin-conjugating enzyme E2 25 isoform X2 n=1 Tax=Cajanus cajan TaxID=3821 RepID=UPI00098DBD54|nr:probable ubiquitin-conjugating enzyme E2 25 isoform X2 [Cajanus cajan]